MTKPTIHTSHASDYATRDEIIREFSGGKGGGLLALRVLDDGRLVLEVYRCDNVEVRVGDATVVFDEMGKASSAAWRSTQN